MQFFQLTFDFIKWHSEFYNSENKFRLKIIPDLHYKQGWRVGVTSYQSAGHSTTRSCSEVYSRPGGVYSSTGGKCQAE